MCLALPMCLVARREFEGDAELGGVQRKVSLLLCPEAEVGDHVLVHAGYAIARIDQAEAQATLALLDATLGVDADAAGDPDRSAPAHEEVES